jgi:hypothetical protein
VPLPKSQDPEGGGRHFPPTVLSKHGLRAQSPEQLLLDLLDSHPEVITSVLQEMADAMQHPPLDILDVLSALSGANVSAFAVAAQRALEG